MAKISISTAKCSMFVLGMEMRCPVCKAVVKSGQKHTCSIENGRGESITVPARKRGVKRG